MFDPTRTPEHCAFRAQGVVYGLRKHGTTGKWVPASGEFSKAFRGHPWVERSIVEGWSANLRAALVRNVTIRMCQDQPFMDIEALMPPADIVEYWSQQARRYREAAEARESGTGAKHDNGLGAFAKVLAPMNRPAFEKMQSESRNGVHRELPGLTSRSRAMSGDRS